MGRTALTVSITLRLIRDRRAVMSGDLTNQLKARGAVFAALIVMILAPSAQALSGNNVTEEFHKTVPLNASGRVSLENVNGNVEITGWDKNEVQIDAVKSARDQQRLDEAKIEVEGSGDAVNIRTRYPEGRANNNPASVHYTLHVPAGRTARKDQPGERITGRLAGAGRSECQPGEWKA